MTQAAETIARPFERVCDTTNTSEWLAHRDGGVGASEIAILLGASEWGSNLELYYRKLGELTSEREDNELMLWGRLLERPILDELARRAEVTLLDEPQRLLRSRSPSGTPGSTLWGGRTPAAPQKRRWRSSGKSPLWEVDGEPL